MASPQEYHRQLIEMELDKFKLSPVTIPDAQGSLRKIQAFQKKLWGLKKGIKSEISNVWDEYRSKSKDSIGDALVAGFLGKRTSYKVRKRKREQLAKERDVLIATYQDTESIIDGFLQQMKNGKQILQDFIQELKAKESKKALKSSAQKSKYTQKKVNYNRYIKSQAWREKAEEAKAQAGNRCQVCNRSRAEVQLDAHHRTYKRLGNELPEDITVLCRECHQLYEDAKKTDKVSKAQVMNSKGYCIRCDNLIKLDPKAPYCYSCFKIWKRFENKEYEEKYCHVCGEENKSTMLKPACYPCYKKQRKKLQF